jgi:hypothetical protein
MPSWLKLPLLVLAAVLLLGTLLVPAEAKAVGQVSLAPKQEKKLKHFKKLKMQSRNAINFWNHQRPDALYPKYKKCSRVPEKWRQRQCHKARRHLAAHQVRYVKMGTRIQEIQFLRWPIGNVSNWLCIYSHEHGRGGWSTNTGNDYWGGLQMDRDFMADYGADLVLKYGGHVVGRAPDAKAYGGEAHLWSMREQMVVAERARRGILSVVVRGNRVVFIRHQVRGYYPWPRTARMCRLI